jgi:hypothetical protein
MPGPGVQGPWLLASPHALRIAEAHGIKKEVPGLSVEGLSYFWIENTYRPGEIRVSEETVSSARSTFSTSIEGIG